MAKKIGFYEKKKRENIRDFKRMVKGVKAQVKAKPKAKPVVEAPKDWMPKGVTAKQWYSLPLWITATIIDHHRSGDGPATITDRFQDYMIDLVERQKSEIESLEAKDKYHHDEAKHEGLRASVAEFEVLKLQQELDEKKRLEKAEDVRKFSMIVQDRIDRLPKSGSSRQWKLIEKFHKLNGEDVPIRRQPEDRISRMGKPGPLVFPELIAQNPPTDIYRQQASIIFGCPPNEVTIAQRQIVKSLMIGQCYGMGTEPLREGGKHNVAITTFRGMQVPMTPLDLKLASEVRAAKDKDLPDFLICYRHYHAESPIRTIKELQQWASHLGQWEAQKSNDAVVFRDNFVDTENLRNDVFDGYAKILAVAREKQKAWEEKLKKGNLT